MTQSRNLRTEAQTEIAAAVRVADLDALETRYLGRNKGLNELSRLIGTLAKDERPAFGAKSQRSAGNAGGAGSRRGGKFWKRRNLTPACKAKCWT